LQLKGTVLRFAGFSHKGKQHAEQRERKVGRSTRGFLVSQKTFGAVSQAKKSEKFHCNFNEKRLQLPTFEIPVDIPSIASVEFSVKTFP
jgi:hypothetical protein